MQVAEVARKHGVSVQKVLTLLEESGIRGKDPASALNDTELSQVEGRLVAMAPKRPVLVNPSVKVLRPGVGTPIIRKAIPGERPSTPARPSGTTPRQSQPKTTAKAVPKKEQPAPDKGEPRRVGVETKARDLLRAKRLRESGIKPKAQVVTPPPEETPVTPTPEPVPEPVPESVQVVAVEAPAPPPPPSSPPPPQPEAAKPVHREERRRPSQGGPQQGGSSQPKRRESGQAGARPSDDRRRPQQAGGKRPPREGESREAKAKPAGEATPPAPAQSPAAAAAAALKRPKGKKAKVEEITEAKKDRESTVVERKVLAFFTGKKKSRSQRYKRTKRERMAATQEAQRERDEKDKTTLRIHEATTVADVAYGLGVNPSEILKILLDLGRVVTVNQRVDRETIDLIAEEFGFNVEQSSLMDVNPFEEFEQPDDPNKLEPRPPVVTVMGHVDHGKTKLMDAIRSADVASGEAGGITQHIGAYFVQLADGKTITFIDTPGHEAFTAMRARGAMVTDVVVLVVAADDGVMPQTREAIAHARAANVPIIVAINKIDVPGANVERVRQELAAEGLLPEEWGGQTPVAEISALKKIGIDSLVDLIHLQAELLELKANPDKRAKGTIIEARLEQGRGAIATALVQEGTLSVGDPIVAGVWSGKVRALMNEHGQRIPVATPGVPVAVLGLSGTPVAGDELRGVPDEKTARELGSKLQQIRREREMAQVTHVTLESLFQRIEEGSVKDLNIIVKGDVQGSVEAVCESFERIESEKVKVRILHRGVGAVSESDIMLASASDAIILGFNVAIPADVVPVQQRERVDVRTYTVIYDAIEDIKKAMLGLLADEQREVVIGRLEVMEIFRSSKAGLVIGGVVREGKLVKGRLVRVLRDNRILVETKLVTLRRFKDEASEVTQGLECGLGIANFQDVHPRDIIECIQTETIAATL